MDLKKLTPAPWFLENEQTKIILSSDIVQRIAWVFDENHTEFIALARNAFDVMMRRGWYPVYNSTEKYWFVRGAKLLPEGAKDYATDPFTALCTADKWYRENVENGK